MRTRTTTPDGPVSVEQLAEDLRRFLLLHGGEAPEDDCIAFADWVQRAEIMAGLLQMFRSGQLSARMRGKEPVWTLIET